MRSDCLILYFSLIISSWLIPSIENRACPELYHRYSSHHTGCLSPNSTCNLLQSGVSAEDIRTILQEHNNYRSRVAMGKETIQNLPKAANMMEMVWDSELAEVAQAHAEQCQFAHDCNDCRKVQNFNVGQNLYQMKTESDTLTETDWIAAVKGWYDEVEYFNKNYIEPFIPSSGEPTYGHFSQVVWAESWRIGCGYTRYKDGSEYFTLYTCNYGPSGNIEDDKMYEKGETCSHCPINSCCDKSCTSEEVVADYAGLCKILDDKGPTYKPVGNFILHCDFEEKGGCQVEVTRGDKKWEISNTLSGSYIGTVLTGGESSTMNLTTPFAGENSICVSLFYRKGPNTAGQEASSALIEHFLIPSMGYQTQILLETDDVEFEKFSMSLGWNMETTFAVSFEVPTGKPEQYVELKDLSVTEGPCE